MNEYNEMRIDDLIPLVEDRAKSLAGEYWYCGTDVDFTEMCSPKLLLGLLGKIRVLNEKLESKINQNIVTPEYLQSWIDRATRAEMELERTRRQ